MLCIWITEHQSIFQFIIQNEGHVAERDSGQQQVYTLCVQCVCLLLIDLDSWLQDFKWVLVSSHWKMSFAKGQWEIWKPFCEYGFLLKIGTEFNSSMLIFSSIIFWWGKCEWCHRRGLRNLNNGLFSDLPFPFRLFLLAAASYQKSLQSPLRPHADSSSYGFCLVCQKPLGRGDMSGGDPEGCWTHSTAAL